MRASLDRLNQDSVLDVVRRALGREATLTPKPLEPFVEAAELHDGQDLISRFTQEATVVMAQVHLVPSGLQLFDKLAEICANHVGEIAMSNADIFRDIDLPRALADRGLQILRADETNHHRLVERLATCSVGVTGAAGAIAETGTVVISSDEASAQLVSLLPPVHVAVIRSSQIVSSLSQAISRINQEQIDRVDPARSVVFITGPSRTGDVELVLSIGVHGPKELHVVIIE